MYLCTGMLIRANSIDEGVRYGKEVSERREQYANIEGPKMAQTILNHPKTFIA